MADVKLIGSGKWFEDQATIWDTGTAPGAGDGAFINGNNNVVELDGNVTVQCVRQDSQYGTVDFAGHTLTTTSATGSDAWKHPRITDGVGGGRLLITCASDGQYSVKLASIDLALTLATALEIAPATDDGNHRINNIAFSVYNEAVRAEGLKVHGVKNSPWSGTYLGHTHFAECEFYDSGGHLYFLRSGPVVFGGEVYVHGVGDATRALRALSAGPITGFGLICGKETNGDADANSGADIECTSSHVALHDSVLSNSPTVQDLSVYGQSYVRIQGYGYAGPSHACNDESTPWDDRLWWADVGTVEKVSATDPSRLATPNSNVSETKPLRVFLPHIPALGGQTVTASVTVSLDSDQPSGSIKAVLDRDGLHGGPWQSSETAEQGQTTVLVASGTLDGATGGLQVPLTVEATDDGGEFTVDHVHVTVGGKSYALNFDTGAWDEVTVEQSTLALSLAVTDALSLELET